MASIFQGVTARIPTFFYENGELDLFALKHVTERAAGAGCPCAVCGNFGEDGALREEERESVVCEACESCRGRAPLFVCLSLRRGDGEIAFASVAAALGASAFLVETDGGRTAGLYAFLKELSRAGLPFAVLRPEGRKNMAQYAEFAALPLFEAVIEEGEKPFEALEMSNLFTHRGRSRAGKPTVVCKNEKSAAFSSVTGAVGMLSNAAAVYPYEMQALWRKTGEKRIFDCLKYLPLFDLFSGEEAPAAVKWAMHLLKLAPPTVRLPLLTPDVAACGRIARAVGCGG